MNPLTLAEIRQAVGARNSRETSTWSPLVRFVCSNSREMQAQSLFVALRGDRFDGHEYLSAAAEGGAVAALVDHCPTDAPADLRLVEVEDTKRAMGRLAAHVRQHLRGKVIAVAGSNGKTGTKYLIHSVLSPALRGTISPKSFNNDIGVPLSIFPADVVQDYLVLEIGTNHPGEIAPLARMANPDIAVITNCSAEHLEGLVDLAGVRQENARIVDGLRHDGLLIINGDDAELLAAVESFEGRTITFGFAASNDLIVSNIVCDANGTEFSLGRDALRWYVPLLGQHAAVNALAAIAIGREMGLADQDIAENLKLANGPDMRLQLTDVGGIRVLNDAYNANPASMKAAIQTLAALPTGGRRIAALGDMRELGEASESCHREIGQFLGRDFPPDQLVCIGTAARSIAQEAMDCGLEPHAVRYYPDAAAAAKAMVSGLRKGDLVLLKGSRAIGLEAIAREITTWQKKLAEVV
ncbi:MAG: UDP-N-acetylmuramoyl-tripeptide--D-alanyl-D-alanine ligase [Planctomycetota bacterium]|nr:UDP-N-acetylmuramoyl-tripeptide--D-alanyl-D-alanine ligase [Planctomycetota bacterium]